MPSLESQRYASKESKEGHINCQNKGELYQSLSESFKTVTMLSMNDEILHTGFGPMSHYLIGIGIV